VEQLRRSIYEERQNMQALDYSRDCIRRKRIALEFSIKAAFLDTRLSPSVSSTHILQLDKFTCWASKFDIIRRIKWDYITPWPHLLQMTTLRKAFRLTNCPPSCVEDLVKATKESGWPVAMSSSETRRHNAIYFDNYVCRRIGQTSALIITERDNKHMCPQFLVKPAFIVAFATTV
jgi:hypothetical protein